MENGLKKYLVAKIVVGVLAALLIYQGIQEYAYKPYVRKRFQEASNQWDLDKVEIKIAERLHRDYDPKLRDSLHDKERYANLIHGWGERIPGVDD